MSNDVPLSSVVHKRHRADDGYQRSGAPLMAQRRRVMLGCVFASLGLLAYLAYGAFRESRELATARMESVKAIESLRRSSPGTASASASGTRCFGGGGGSGGGQWKCY